MPRGTLLFCSALALDPPFLRVAEILGRRYNLDVHVVAPNEYLVPPVYHPSGVLSADTAAPHGSALQVHYLHAHRDDVERFGFERRRFNHLVRSIHPTHIWIHGEFWEGIASQVLGRYRWTQRPKVIAYVAINHLPGAGRLIRRRPPFVNRTRLSQLWLWPRLDGVSACSSKARDCARRIGLPKSVPTLVNYLPAFGPEDADKNAADWPWHEHDQFVVGFAGLLNEQKGWRVLLAAMALLPPRVKLVIVGDGDDRGRVEREIAERGLGSRVLMVGAIARPRLLATYPRFNAFVLPSITLPDRVEQFGAVIAEAMACGVPVIGSDSGAIPEAIGDVGIVVRERDPEALAAAVVRLAQEASLADALRAAGRERHRRLFSCDAYARSLANLLHIAL
jgi:glycosyltransferase involved in cell wall biosynthesis